MSNISTRLDNLNQQLMIISKLQSMEEESNIHPHPICKRYSTQNTFGKLCHCAHRFLSLKEQCKRLNCMDECVPCDSCKKRLACTARTCKARNKLLVCKNTRLSEVQTDLRNDVRVSRSVSTNVKNNMISQSSVQVKVEQSKSDQVNLSSQLFTPYASDKIIDTYEEKSEQTIPTKDHVPVESNVNNSNRNSVQVETARTEQILVDSVKNAVQETSELGEFDYSVEDIPVKDKKIFERIQKDLLNERKRNKDLEKKLKSLTCSFNCLKEDSEQRAACLKGALETAEEQTKLAMNLMRQSTDQADLVKRDRDELTNEITKLQQQIIEVAHKNTLLTQDRDDLKNKLKSLSEDEANRCEEIEKEVNRMKCAVKEKEDALNKERAEFMNMILELTNVIKIQKRRICEVTSICNNQQHTLQEKEQQLSQTNTELSEVQNILHEKNCICKEMEEQIQHLKYCLCEETKACNCLKQELETLKENHSSELRIKEKIAEEQNRTIAKQRKLLHDSENVAQQAASEFDQLKEELYKERQRNKSLQISLSKADNELKNVYSLECDRCRTLRSEIDFLKKEKQKALTIAKFAYQKLNQSTKDYQKELVCEKQQHKHMALIIEKKEKEIVYLQNQIYQNNTRSIKKMNSHVM